MITQQSCKGCSSLPPANFFLGRSAIPLFIPDIFLATERPRLKLQPRTIPKDDEKSSDMSSPVQSAIFGGAKPVDTATREKEIAARLEKENSEKESREVTEGKGGDRRRFKSTSSEDNETKIEKRYA